MMIKKGNLAILSLAGLPLYQPYLHDMVIHQVSYKMTKTTSKLFFTAKTGLPYVLRYKVYIALYGQRYNVHIMCME